LASQSDAHQRSTLGDNSMRCTLRRGRPNTPKTGLSVEYRIRKSSVPNTPEFKHAAMSKINSTISNDDIKVKPDFDRVKPAPIKAKSKSKTSVITSLSSTSLNTAMVHVDDEANLNKGEEECDDALDIALIGDEDIEDDNEAENINDQHINEDYNSNSNSSLLSGSRSARTSPSVSPRLNNNSRQLSLSLSNLPPNNTSADFELKNTTASSDKPSICCEIEHECEPVCENLEDKPVESEIAADADVEMNSLKKEETTNELAAEKKDEPTPANTFILEQQKLINFEPFEFKMPDDMAKTSGFEQIFDQQFKEGERLDDNMLQNVLRRQSLFKLKEKINGKVSKQISEIEKRKLSPYRFSNSPLKHKKYKDSSSGLSVANHITKHASPIRVPSIFCKKILADAPQDSYIVKAKRTGSKLSKTIATSKLVSPKGNDENAPSSSINEVKLPTDSPLIVRAANSFYKKLNRNRSIKRLNVTLSQTTQSNLSAISEHSQLEKSSILKSVDLNSKSMLDDERNSSNSMIINKNVSMQSSNSPIGKNLVRSNELKCTDSSIDL
jgi:hypothetical protein